METYRTFFEGRKITLMGLGLLGRGVGDAAFLASCGADVTVTDLKKQSDLEASLKQLEGYKNIGYRLGEHRIEDFETADMVIKAAGVPLDSEYIKAAKAKDVPVYMSTALFVKFAKGKELPVIGVTGTRGKSTVTDFIYNGLKAAGKKVLLGGNVRGVSTLSKLPEIEDFDVAVLELDSWQLQGFRDLKLSPDIAVFTNLMRDHMNYYKGDMGRYYFDKAGIFEFQKETDTVIAGAEIGLQISDANPASTLVRGPALPDDWTLSVPGAHTRENAGFALAALNAFGVESEVVKNAFENYKGLDGRLYKVDEVKGISFYNDSNATTPAALEAALKSFEGKKVHLITGGADKGLDVDTLPALIRKYTQSVVLLNGSGTEKLRENLPNVSIENSMDGAFITATQHAERGDIVLLSPGFASFGLFKNEYDRSDQFNALVRSYALQHKGEV
jgi:UDP-N-acetylmuramoylalanine--D-glutamate ligase